MNFVHCVICRWIQYRFSKSHIYDQSFNKRTNINESIRIPVSTMGKCAIIAITCVLSRCQLWSRLRSLFDFLWLSPLCVVYFAWVFRGLLHNCAWLLLLSNSLLCWFCHPAIRFYWFICAPVADTHASARISSTINFYSIEYSKQFYKTFIIYAQKALRLLYAH